MVKDILGDDKEYQKNWRNTHTKARKQYGHYLHLVTGQDSCAYCDTNLMDEYRPWLVTSVDHVIPWTAVEKNETTSIGYVT